MFAPPVKHMNPTGITQNLRRGRGTCRAFIRREKDCGEWVWMGDVVMWEVEVRGDVVMWVSGPVAA